MRMRGYFGWILVLAVAGVSGCNWGRGVTSSRGAAGEFRAVPGRGITNFFLLSATVYSGSAPEGEEGFKTLERLGVKTIITVDGMIPDVGLAAKHGLRYVHLPIGYDGASRSNALRIIKAAEVMPGPVFVHCHHGQHRGPTAAALVCEGLYAWSPEQAETWLRAVGTSTNYPGLYRTVREFDPPTERELGAVPDRFPSRAKPPDLVQTMVQVDGHFDTLKALQKTSFKPLPQHPDATAANESLLLLELFKEAHRTKQGAGRGDAFQAELIRAIGTAENLNSALRDMEANPAAGTAPAGAALENMTKACAACHKAYRN
jgi:hypothetical protein